MTQTPHDPRDSGLFDLDSLLTTRSQTFPPRWVEIKGPDPAPQPSRRSRWWALPLAGLLTAFTAVAFAWAPAVPVAPMHVAVSTTSETPRAAQVPIHVVPTVPHAAAVTPEEVAPPPARVRTRRAVATRRAAPPAPPAAAPAPSSAPARTWATGSGSDAPLDRSIDSLLDAAVGATAADPRPTETVSLPPTPTRRQVSTTLRALEGEVGQCGEGAVTVRLTVDGDTGRVSRASVSGADSGAVAGCVQDVVESARFPRFEQDQFVVVFPYRL